MKSEFVLDLSTIFSIQLEHKLKIIKRRKVNKMELLINGLDENEKMICKGYLYTTLEKVDDEWYILPEWASVKKGTVKIGKGSLYFETAYNNFSIDDIEITPGEETIIKFKKPTIITVKNNFELNTKDKKTTVKYIYVKKGSVLEARFPYINKVAKIEFSDRFNQQHRYGEIFFISFTI